MPQDILYPAILDLDNYDVLIQEKLNKQISDLTSEISTLQLDSMDIDKKYNR